MAAAARGLSASLGTGLAIPQLQVLLVTGPGLIWRILDEQKLLSDELRGYGEYPQQLRYPPIAAPRLARRSGRRG